jgi:hypothetical protein
MQGRAVACVALGVLALAAPAVANGRFPAAVTITFRDGHPQEAIAGATFGALVSYDGGTTWRWICEQAIGYGGAYDPDYAFSDAGTIFATTFDGLKANRNACTFDATPLGQAFVAQVEPEGTAVLAAMSDPADAKIYASANDGVSFPTSTSPGMNNDFWTSLAHAPSDAQRVYLTGSRIAAAPLLFTSTTGGGAFSPMATTGMTLSANSHVTIVGVALTSLPVPTVMRVDRPFVFVIRERLSGTVLFMGKITRLPSA